MPNLSCDEFQNLNPHVTMRKGKVDVGLVARLAETSIRQKLLKDVCVKVQRRCTCNKFSARGSQYSSYTRNSDRPTLIASISEIPILHYYHISDPTQPSSIWMDSHITPTVTTWKKNSSTKIPHQQRNFSPQPRVSLQHELFVQLGCEQSRAEQKR